MKAIFITLVIVSGLALLVVGVTLLIRPDWLGIPGGVLILVGVAFLAVAGLGGKLKDWRDLLFGEQKNDGEETEPVGTASFRSQEMKRSASGVQEMSAQGGIQIQNMDNSPGGSQKMK